MTQTFSRPRQQAEIAFAQAQSTFRARARALDELDAIAEARREKTLGLRNSRLAKEQKDRAEATITGSATKRSEKA